MSVDTTRYISGDSIVPITFTITNVSNKRVNFTNVNGNSDFNFQVYNSSNYEVYSRIYGAYPLNNANMALTPNQTTREHSIGGK